MVVLTYSGVLLVKEDTTIFDNWVFKLRPHLISNKAQKIWICIYSYYNWLAFNQKNLKDYRSKLIYIQLEDDYQNFWWTFKFSILKKLDVQTYCQ